LRIPHSVDIEAVLESLAGAVRAVAPEVEIDVFEKICPASRTSADSQVARAMVASHAEAGAPAHVWPSAPWWAPFYLFSEARGLSFASGGAGHAGRAHASNEYASIEGLRTHMKHSISFLYRYAYETAGP
jgi:acetylornithine deacetylase/succinyl-diaminopimelate desuccinylase-like protein